MALVGQPIEIGTASTTLMTVPATLEASLHSLLISNPTGGNLDVTLSFFDSGTSSELSLLTQTVTSDTTLKAFDAPINMAAGDKVNASASGTGLVALVSRFENSSTPAEVGFTARGNYTATTTYAINDVVFLESDSNSYLSRTASNLNNVPSSNPSNWQIFGAKGATGDVDLNSAQTLTNKTIDSAVSVSAAGAITSGTVVSDVDGNLRDIPLSGSIKSDAYTLAVGDAGNHVVFNSANVNFTVPATTFGTGDIVSIISTNGATATISSGITNMFVAEGASATATATIGANGVASILFLSASYAVLTGNVS
tara:strand:+ start:311 stop:1243 length:933 start_codon:yes stop_codon:yes gene_type:complete